MEHFEDHPAEVVEGKLGEVGVVKASKDG